MNSIKVRATTADMSGENYRTRRPRDRRESVCWAWLGHRFFILIFDNYIHIGNESNYKRIKVLIKFVCRLPFTFYFYSSIQFFNFRTKIPLLPWKTAIAQPPPPPLPLTEGHWPWWEWTLSLIKFCEY